VNQWVAIGIGALAFVAWASTLVHGLLLLRHRVDHISLTTLFFSGWRFYQQDTWKPSGWPIHRRFVVSALAFFVILVAGVVVGALGAST
jgi:hypothetical protein